MENDLITLKTDCKLTNGRVFKVLNKHSTIIWGTLLDTVEDQTFPNTPDYSDKRPWFAFTGALFSADIYDIQSGYIYSDGNRVLTDNSNLPLNKHTMSLEYSKNNNIGERFSYRFCENSITKPFLGVNLVPKPFEDSPKELPREGEGLGGLYPILHKVGDIVYKVVNVDPPTAIEPGEIRGFQYNVFKKADSNLGKCIFSVNQNNNVSYLKDSLCIFLQLDELSSFPIDKIRDRLFDLGYEDSVGMDGSGSAFVYDICGDIEYSNNMTSRPRFMSSMVVIGGIS